MNWKDEVNSLSGFEEDQGSAVEDSCSCKADVGSESEVSLTQEQHDELRQLMREHSIEAPAFQLEMEVSPSTEEIFGEEIGQDRNEETEEEVDGQESEEVVPHHFAKNAQSCLYYRLKHIFYKQKFFSVNPTVGKALRKIFCLKPEKKNKSKIERILSFIEFREFVTERFSAVYREYLLRYPKTEWPVELMLQVINDPDRRRNWWPVHK